MPSPLETEQIATLRTEVFPPDQVYDSKFAGRFYDVFGEHSHTMLKQHAYPVLAIHLQKAGMPASLAMLFLVILYKAGKDLNYPILKKRLADELGTDASNMPRSIKPLIEIGVIEELEPPLPRPSINMQSSKFSWNE